MPKSQLHVSLIWICASDIWIQISWRLGTPWPSGVKLLKRQTRMRPSLMMVKNVLTEDRIPGTSLVCTAIVHWQTKHGQCWVERVEGGGKVPKSPRWLVPVCLQQSCSLVSQLKFKAQTRMLAGLVGWRLYSEHGEIQIKVTWFKWTSFFNTDSNVQQGLFKWWYKARSMAEKYFKSSVWWLGRNRVDRDREYRKTKYRLVFIQGPNGGIRPAAGRDHLSVDRALAC